MLLIGVGFVLKFGVQIVIGWLKWWTAICACAVIRRVWDNWLNSPRSYNSPQPPRRCPLSTCCWRSSLVSVYRKAAGIIGEETTSAHGRPRKKRRCDENSSWRPRTWRPHIGQEGSMTRWWRNKASSSDRKQREFDRKFTHRKVLKLIHPITCSRAGLDTLSNDKMALQSGNGPGSSLCD